MARVIGQISFIADGLSGSARSRAGYDGHSTALTVRSTSPTSSKNAEDWQRNRSLSALDGPHGSNASQAQNGEDGGNLRLALEPNPGNGGLFVLDLNNKTHRQEREVPVGYDVFASARGGQGEDGGVGGNGGNGREGYRGTDATQTADATVSAHTWPLAKA